MRPGYPHEAEPRFVAAHNFRFKAHKARLVILSSAFHLNLLNRQRFSIYLQQHQSTSDIDDISIIVSAFPSSIHRYSQRQIWCSENRTMMAAVNGFTALGT